MTATQTASNQGSIANYRFVSSSCRDYCLTGLYKGGALGDPGYFYFSVIPNEMMSHLMRFSQGTYDTSKKERKLKEKVDSKFCFGDQNGCPPGKE